MERKVLQIHSTHLFIHVGLSFLHEKEMCNVVYCKHAVWKPCEAPFSQGHAAVGCTAAGNLPTPRWEGLTGAEDGALRKALSSPHVDVCDQHLPKGFHSIHMQRQRAWCHTYCSQASTSQHLPTAEASRINGTWEWIHCIFLEEFQAEEQGLSCVTCYQSPVCISSAQAGCQGPACFTSTHTAQNTSHDWCQCCLGLGWHVMLWKRWTLGFKRVPCCIQLTIIKYHSELRQVLLV